MNLPSLRAASISASDLSLSQPPRGLFFISRPVRDSLMYLVTPSDQPRALALGLFLAASLASGMVRRSMWQVDQQPFRLAPSTLLSSNMTVSFMSFFGSIFVPPPGLGSSHSKRR